MGMHKIKVLYIEDEMFLGKIVKESLESRGFEVLMESDGARALSSFTRLRPDVCVLDVMLPNKDGLEIAEQIRHLDKEVPILFVTAKGRTEDVVKGFTLGGNDYIRKPFSMEQMIVRIHNTLRNRETPFTPALTDGPINMGKYSFLWKKQVLMLGEEQRSSPSGRTSSLNIFILIGTRSSIARTSFNCYGEMTAFSTAATWTYTLQNYAAICGRMNRWRSLPSRA